jgi:uncharacterized YccA/Bax inhibitor family protein
MALENPALNDHAFERAMTDVPASERKGLHIAAVYLMTGFLLVVLALAAAFGWSQVEVKDVTYESGTTSTIAQVPRWFGLVSFLTVLIGLVAIFAPRTAVLTGTLYTLGQGAMIGVISHFYELDFEGIVAQAVAGTLGIFLAMLLLYATRIVKVTRGLVLFLVAASFGLLLLYGVSWILWLFGVEMRFLDEPTSAGIAISLGIVILGAAYLPTDFNFIERVAKEGAPGWMQFYAAFGLILSLIWIYVALLRLIALLRMAQR